MLRGRRDECAALEGLLQRIRVGESAVLVLRGEAGIGKTALLEFVAAQATGCRVERAVGVQAAVELAFVPRVHRAARAQQRGGRTRAQPAPVRREHRRTEAREQLRSASADFSRFGPEAFAERARREIRATGETVRRLTADTRDALTPQALQVALLAREGHTNPEIGAQLFISPRTVEYHLRKVFRKLDVGSRKELRIASWHGC